MNNSVDTVKYSFYNIGQGIYKAYFDGGDICCLSLIKTIKTKTIKAKTPNIKNKIYKLNKNDSYLIYKHIKDLKPEIIKISNQYLRDYNIILTSEEKYSCDEKHNHRCDEEHKYKEIYIKIDNEEPISIYLEKIISELGMNRSYNISSFSEISEYSGIIITSNGYKYYVYDKVISTLNKYFKCEDGKIICMYNNKKEVAKLTLITEDKLQYSQELLQSLKLEIDNKEFTFYINRYKNYDYKKEYYFLVFHIHNHSIYGYEYLEDRYYNLSSWTFILKYVKQEIIKKFEEYKSQDIYTYLSINNNYCGLCTKIDNNYHETTYIALNIDEVFEDILDISLLKPVDEWNDEEINAKKEYYEKEYKDNIENNTNKDTKDNTEK